jgi:hypothetical protein
VDVRILRFLHQLLSLLLLLLLQIHQRIGSQVLRLGLILLLAHHTIDALLALDLACALLRVKGTLLIGLVLLLQVLHELGVVHHILLGSLLLLLFL